MVAKSAKTAVPNEAPTAPVDAERRRGRGARSNHTGRFEAERREDVRRRLGGPRRPRRLQDRGLRRAGAHHHHAQRQPRHLLRPLDQPLPRLRARLHLLLRAPDPLLSSGIRPGSTSRPSSTPSRTPPSCSRRSWPIRATSPRPSRSAPTPTPTSRSSASGASRARSSRCWSAPRIPSASSPSRRSSCATSTSSRAWPSAGLARVALSVTTLDRRIARAMEPRAATPAKRLEAIRRLSEAGIPTTVMVAPIVPGLNDQRDRDASSKRRARRARASAGYVLLRLPLEIKVLFREWLATEFPDRAERVIHLMQSMHGGRDYNSEFGVRQRGTGPYAEQIGTALPPRGQAARPQRGSRAAAHRPLPAPRARRATNAAFLNGFPTASCGAGFDLATGRAQTCPAMGNRRATSAADVRAGGCRAAAPRRPGRRRRRGRARARSPGRSSPPPSSSIPQRIPDGIDDCKGARRGDARGPLRAHPRDRDRRRRHRRREAHRPRQHPARHHVGHGAGRRAARRDAEARRHRRQPRAQRSSCPSRTIVKGDARCLSIAAASIIAKVTRDRMMVQLGAKHPGYGFERHKGYGDAPSTTTPSAASA